MYNPIDTHSINNLDTSNFDTIDLNTNTFLKTIKDDSSEGELNGHRVINSTHRIKKIRDKCNWELLSPIQKFALGMMGVAIAVIGIGLILFAAFTPPVAIVAPLLFTVGAFLILPGVGVPLFAGLAYESSVRLKIAITKNEDFIDWAEKKQIKLKSSNIDDHYDSYKLYVEEKLRHQNLKSKFKDL